MISLVLILPAEYRDAGNALAVALGHDVKPGNTYSVPLSASGDAPATHYGCHAWSTDEFVRTIDNAHAGNIPQGLPSGTLKLLDALVSSAQPDTEESALHFEMVLAENNLQRIAEKATER